MNLCLIDVLDGMNWLVCVLMCCFWVVSLLHARNSDEYCYSRSSELVSPRRE